MKLSLCALILAGVGVTRAFLPIRNQQSLSPTSSSICLSSSSLTKEAQPTATKTTTSATTATSAFAKPERVVHEDLPTLYVYDHCPFCVRVRLALGVKNIKHNLHFMANDDVRLPTDLVGKKIAPIFNFPAAEITMAESMDIVKLIDNDERFGPIHAIKPSSGRKDLKSWQKSVQSLLRTLQRPRYVATGLLPEFQQLDARHAFIINHQLPPYDKTEWREMDDIDEKIRIYADELSSDPAPMVEELSARLVELDDIIYCDEYCTKGGFSLDDIDLWARVRSITIIKGVQWPKKLRKYMDNLSELGDIPLYDELAM